MRKKGRNQCRMCAGRSPTPTNVNSAVWPPPTHTYTYTPVAQVCIPFPHAFETTERQKQIVTVMLHTFFSFFTQFIYVQVHVPIYEYVCRTAWSSHDALRYEFMMDIQRAADVVVVFIIITIIIFIFIHIVAVAATIAIVVARPFYTWRIEMCIAKVEGKIMMNSFRHAKSENWMDECENMNNRRRICMQWVWVHVAHERSIMADQKNERKTATESADRTNNVGKRLDGWMDVWWVICQSPSKYHLMADIAVEINCRRHLCSAQINFIHLSAGCVSVSGREATNGIFDAWNGYEDWGVKMCCD